MPYRASVTPPSSDMEDPLSLAYNHASTSKSRSKSTPTIDLKRNEHLTSLYRVGRIVTSIFDRGRHMQYDYRITSEKTYDSSRHGSSATPAHYDVTNTSSQKSSRSSSLDTSSKAGALADTTLSNSSTRESSRRTSSESTSGRRRRGGMSVS